VASANPVQDFTLRFRLGSIPVVIEPWFWAMALFTGANQRGPDVVLWVIVVFVSIMVHELGHAVFSRLFGASAWIRLYSFGGLTYPDRTLPRLRSIAMSLAGPFAGFALAGLVYAILWQFPWVFMQPKVHTLLSMFLWVNLSWGVMNLLPVPPLDGGHVLLDALGPKRKTMGHTIGMVVCALVVVYGLMKHELSIVGLFGMFGYSNYQILQSKR
jgi:Zn-dependent protease